jgi:hypothetical protein
LLTHRTLQSGQGEGGDRLSPASGRRSTSRRECKRVVMTGIRNAGPCWINDPRARCEHRTYIGMVAGPGTGSDVFGCRHIS